MSFQKRNILCLASARSVRIEFLNLPLKNTDAFAASVKKIYLTGRIIQEKIKIFFTSVILS